MTSRVDKALQGAVVVAAGTLIGFLSAWKTEPIAPQVQPISSDSAPQTSSSIMPAIEKYGHGPDNHLAQVGEGKQGYSRCFDVFPTDPILPPSGAAFFEDWHRRHYGTEAKDVRMSSGVNWRLVREINGEGVYVSYGECKGYHFARIATANKLTAVLDENAGPIESRLDAILAGMR